MEEDLEKFREKEVEEHNVDENIGNRNRIEEMVKEMDELR